MCHDGEMYSFCIIMGDRLVFVSQVKHLPHVPKKRHSNSDWALACNSYSSSMSRGYACALVTCGLCAGSLLSCVSVLLRIVFLLMKITHSQFSYELSSCDLLMYFFLLSWTFESKRCPFFGFLVSQPLGRNAARTETLTELGASTSCGSTSKSYNEDTHHLIISMQEILWKHWKERNRD